MVFDYLHGLLVCIVQVIEQNVFVAQRNGNLHMKLRSSECLHVFCARLNCFYFLTVKIYDTDIAVQVGHNIGGKTAV